MQKGNIGNRERGTGNRDGEPANAERPSLVLCHWSFAAAKRPRERGDEGRGNCQNGRRRPTAGIRDPGLGGRGGEGRGVNRLGVGADTTALILRFSAGRHAPGTRQGSPRHRHPGRQPGNTGLESTLPQVTLLRRETPGTQAGSKSGHEIGDCPPAPARVTRRTSQWSRGSFQRRKQGRVQQTPVSFLRPSGPVRTLSGRQFQEEQEGAGLGGSRPSHDAR